MSDNRLLESRYLKSEMPKVDRAYGVPSTYNDQRGVFLPQQPQYQLEEALSQYRNLNSSLGSTFDPKKCSWNDVYRLLAEVRSQYDAKTKKPFVGPIRNTIRKAGDNADSITPVLDFIPDEYGLSILRSALGLVFTLLKDASKHRKDIFDAFEEIPNIIMEARMRKQNFPELNDLAANLDDALFQALPKLIAYLLPKNLVAKVLPIFNDTPSGSDIDLTIESVRKAASSLKERSGILLEALSVKAYHQGEKRGREVQAELHAVRHTGLSALHTTQTISHQVSQVEDIMQPIPDKVQGLQQSMDELTQKFSTGEATVNELTSTINRTAIGVQNSTMDMFTYMVQMFGAVLEDRKSLERRLLHAHRYIEMGIGRPQTPQHVLLSAHELLQILDAPLETVTRDLVSIVQQGLHFSPMQQGQAQWLLKKDRFWQWFSTSPSDLLLVHGNLTDASDDNGRTSALSVVCTTIASAITKQENCDAIALYYFCGLHMSSVDDLNGPQGLMRCLISRLIVGLKAKYGIVANLGFMDGPYIEALERRDVSCLCAAFRSILAQYPPNTTVYCIVDGISWYERHEMTQDLFRVVQSLCGLVDEGYGGPAVKVLLTSPFRSRHIVSGIPVARQIVLESEAVMLEEPSERMLFSNFGPRAYDAPGFAVAGGQARRMINQEDEEWIEGDYT